MGRMKEIDTVLAEFSASLLAGYLEVRMGKIRQIHYDGHVKFGGLRWSQLALEIAKSRYDRISKIDKTIYSGFRLFSDEELNDVRDWIDGKTTEGASWVERAVEEVP